MNQRVVWNSISASRPLVSAVRALLPFVGGVVPGGGVEEAEPGGPLRIGRGKGQRDAAAHRRPRDDGGAPADVIEEVGEVVGEGLDPIGAGGLVGAAMAAAIIDQHGGGFRQRRGDRVPEGVIHPEGMNEDDRRGVLHASAEFVGELRPVTDLHCRDCHLAQPCGGVMPDRSTSGPHGCQLHTHIMRASKVPVLRFRHAAGGIRHCAHSRATSCTSSPACGGGSPTHSALRPSSLMIGHHFSASAFCKAASVSGVCCSRGKASYPSSASRDRAA